MLAHLRIPEEFRSRGQFQPGQMGHDMDILRPDGANALGTYKIAFLGLEPQSAAAIRRTLYSYARPDAMPRIVDLGNIREDHPEALLEVLRGLRLAHVIPILLGGDERELPSVMKALVEEAPALHWASVDKMHRQLMLEDKIYHPGGRLQWHWIGVQKHLFQPLQGPQKKTDHLHYRLGVVRHDIREMEPVIRDCAALDINLCAVRSSEAPANREAGPSGFYSEEICQLSRYAGLSDHIRLFRVTGLDAALDQNGFSATCAAQSIWYFIEAIAQRKSDHPAVSERMTSYTVSLKDPDLEIIFVKSQRSGRWWIALTNEGSGEVQYLSCSHKDYLMACQNILPDRYLNAAMTEHIHDL